MLKLQLVTRCPFGIDSLFSDKAVPSTLCVLVDVVHSAFIDSITLIVMVRNNTVIGLAEKRRN